MIPHVYMVRHFHRDQSTPETRAVNSLFKVIIHQSPKCHTHDGFNCKIIGSPCDYGQYNFFSGEKSLQNGVIEVSLQPLSAKVSTYGVGTRPLFFACLHHSKEMVQLLLDNGEGEQYCQPSTLITHERAPGALSACSSMHCIALHISLDPSLPDTNGKNGLHYASEHFDEEILKLIWDHLTKQRYV